MADKDKGGEAQINPMALVPAGEQAANEENSASRLKDKLNELFSKGYLYTQRFYRPRYGNAEWTQTVETHSFYRSHRFALMMGEEYGQGGRVEAQQAYIRVKGPDILQKSSSEETFVDIAIKLRGTVFDRERAQLYDPELLYSPVPGSRVARLFGEFLNSAWDGDAVLREMAECQKFSGQIKPDTTIEVRKGSPQTAVLP